MLIPAPIFVPAMPTQALLGFTLEEPAGPGQLRVLKVVLRNVTDKERSWLEASKGRAHAVQMESQGQSVLRFNILDAQPACMGEKSRGVFIPKVRVGMHGGTCSNRHRSGGVA
jgi:hypothetical protein